MTIGDGDTVMVEMVGGIQHGGVVKAKAYGLSGGAVSLLFENGRAAASVPVSVLLKVVDSTDLDALIPKFFNRPVAIRTSGGDDAAQELMGVIVDAFIGETDAGVQERAYATVALIDRDGIVGSAATIEIDPPVNGKLDSSLEKRFRVLPNSQAPRY